MKTLKIFVVLCFIAAFAVNNVKAQNGAVKEEFYIDMGGQYFDCTGDYLCGYLIFEVIITKNNYLAFSKKRMLQVILIPMVQYLRETYMSSIKWELLPD
jgi:hypothetical protein